MALIRVIHLRRAPAWVTIVLACMLLPGTLHADTGLAAGLQAYQVGDYMEASRIAANHLEQPRARLVQALCLVHDAKNGDQDQGLEALLQLYRDETAERAVRLEAGLSYGRMIQLLQVRGLHPQFDDIDVAAFFHEFIAFAANDEYACLAALNLSELYCDAWLTGNDPEQGRQALAFLEHFLSKYQGNPSDLLPLHLLAEGLHEEINEDFRKCYQHLDAAYRLGITKMQVERTVLFKMGRINHIKLNDPERAARYYREFLQAFPNAQRTPQVRRYLSELTEENP